MRMVVEILESVSIMLLGAMVSKPIGWVAVVLGALILLLVVFGGVPMGHG